MNTKIKRYNQSVKFNPKLIKHDFSILFKSYSTNKISRRNYETKGYLYFSLN